MTQSTKNVWENFTFNDVKKKSALVYLNEIKPGLSTATKNELKIEIEAVDAYVETPNPRLAAIYMLYVVAPKLGNFRKKILTVVEYNDTGRFPVIIINHFEDKNISDINDETPIDESAFVDKINEILTHGNAKKTIEDLYQLSKEQKRR